MANYVPSDHKLSRTYTVAEVLHGNVRRYPVGLDGETLLCVGLDGETLLCVFGAMIAQAVGEPGLASVLRNQASYNIAKRITEEPLRCKRERLDG